MPHFDQYGGDEWICQAPNHIGNRVQNSRVDSSWRPDITGHESAGNCCPPCIAAFDVPDQFCLTQPDGDCVSTDPRCMHQPEPLNPLDFDDRAEYELQVELRSRGLENKPEPICCPQCQGDLETHKGMVGERILTCPAHGIVWEDQEDAIRRVF